MRTRDRSGISLPFMFIFVWLIGASPATPMPPLLPPSQEVDPATVLGLFNPDGFDAPQSVTIVGTVQTTLGCSGNWQPQCNKTSLTYIPEYDIWQGAFDLPAGHYQYKAVLNGSWEQNYGLGAEAGGRRISLDLESDRSVRFYYDHNTGWITDSVNSIITALKGINTKACFEWDDIGEFAPPCMQTFLQDIDGDGIYSFQTPHLYVGDHVVTVVEDHGPNSEFAYYGKTGTRGFYYDFSVPAERTLITFTWDLLAKFSPSKQAGMYR